MYLAEFLKEQQESFIDLSIYAIKANGEIAAAEQTLLECYCCEMDIEKAWNEPRKSLAETLMDLKKNSSRQDLKKITVEIMALVLADGEYDQAEKEFLSVVQEAFGFNDNDMNKLLFATEHVMLSYKLLEKAVR